MALPEDVSLLPPEFRTGRDTYMVSGGVPDPRPDHAAAVAGFALKLLDSIPKLWSRDSLPLQLRVGIHSGPVVAGVVGEKRFAYDLWGDTVNTASRMESSGEVGRIQISLDTRAMLGDEWEVESRGEIEIRGKGHMQTSFLTGKENVRGKPS